MIQIKARKRWNFFLEIWHTRDNFHLDGAKQQINIVKRYMQQIYRIHI